MDDDDDFDEASEMAWVAEQCKVIADYLHQEGIEHGEIGEWPAWHVQPYLAIFAIESGAFAGSVGWWCISGDCPTDYLSYTDADHPREAIRVFAQEWAEVAYCMLRGEPHPTKSIGRVEQWPELGDLLQRRANLLFKFVEDDTLWEDSNA